MSFTDAPAANEGTDYEPVEVIPGPAPEASSDGSFVDAGTSSSRVFFIGPRAVALSWLVAGLIASWVNPGTTESIQPTLLLTVLSGIAAFAWLGTIVAGAFKLGPTAIVGFMTGAVMLTGHFICGVDGHLPMTGGIWIGQLMLIAGATAISGLAWATRR
ncbi:MAG: hypothetical protein ACR2PK_15215 [Acidimicrobiales bacterium]